VGITSPWAIQRRRLARLCACLAVAGFLATMARPTIPVEPTGRTGILELVVDVSGSTNADDLVPTRLEVVQQATVRLLARLPPLVRVGLVSFSTSAVTLAHPTTDHARVGQEITAFKASGATALGEALQRALHEIEASRPAAPAWVLLLSDGANTSGISPSAVAPVAAARQVPVLAVGSASRTR
jgi:Ca-activated chloride channel family protein